MRKRHRDSIKHAKRRYERHRRHNLLYARPGQYEFVVILDNLKPSFNIGKIFRSCDAFGAREIHLIGTDFFDISAAKGSFKWVPAVYHQNFAQCHTALHAKGYTFYVLEPNAKQTLQQVQMAPKSCFIVGHEEFGTSFEKSEYSDIQSICIPQYGRVGSLNVSIAASIVMYEYLRQQM